MSEPGSTGRVFFPDLRPEYTGTAWLCGRTWLVTAAHVVGDRGQRHLHPGLATVEFPWGKLAARVAKHDFDLDVALLALEATDRLPPDVSGLSVGALPGLSVGAPQDSPLWWKAYGFPAAHEPGLMLDGTVVSADTGVVDGQRGLVQLHCQQGGRNRLGGASGAAVCVGGVAVAVLRYGVLDQETIFATPLTLACSRFPELEPLPRTPARAGVPTSDPVDLYVALSRILPASFAGVVFRLRVPAGKLLPDTVPQGRRAIELVEYCTALGASGLERLARSIESEQAGVLAVVVAERGA